MARVLILVSVAVLAVGCSKKDNQPAARAEPAAPTPAPTSLEPAPTAAKAAPPADAAPPDAAPAPFILSEAECREASARSYTLARHWNPKKLTGKQKADVAAYAADMEGQSLASCRRNTREWYDCKMAAADNFEAEDCNMIGAESDADEMP